MASTTRRRVRSLAWACTGLAGATYALIVLGALVRAHGAGLACPDWPLCFGELVPRFDLPVAFEWSHRLLAGVVGLGFLGVSLLVWRERDAWARVGRTLALAGLLLAVQVVLGGLTVRLQLAPWTVTAHLLTGNGLCLALVWAARDLFQAEPEAARSSASPGRFMRAALAVGVLLLAVQLTLGGLVASHAAGLACASFPTCDGVSFAPTLQGLVGLQVLHRIVGVALLVSLAAVAWSTRGRGLLGTLARMALRLALLQIAVGALNVLLRLPVEVTALHSALATALVLVNGLVVREILRLRELHPAAQHGPGGCGEELLQAS